MPEKRVYRVLVLLGIFGVAMGFLEAIVVVYLRELYYPMGFNFPLHFIYSRTIWLEVAREFCTVVMLLALSLIAGKNRLQKFSYFLYTFAVWDIFYYGGLKIFLGWPPSLLTWDILFLIPFPWVGPVLAPIVCSLTMILMATAIVSLQERGYRVHIKWREWLLAAGGASIIFVTFIRDYAGIVFRGDFLRDFFSLSLVKNRDFRRLMLQHKPGEFAWLLFILGEVLLLLALTLVWRRSKKSGGALD